MSEANQVKWVGIRPTNPPENIPIDYDPIGDGYHEKLSDLLVSAGNHSLAGTVVPAGEKWVVHNMLAMNFDSITTLTELDYKDASNTYWVRRVMAPPVNAEIISTVKLILYPGYKVSAYFKGCTLNDNIYFHVIGYKLNL